LTRTTLRVRAAPLLAPEDVISIADIVQAFRWCGVGRGDTLMLHADAMALGQLPPMSPQARFDVLFDALDQLLGPDGTLVMPTFSYSFTKGEPFDPAATPSAVGLLSEAFRGRPGVRRSRDPIFSVAARGRLADRFVEAAADDCFGPDSAFARLAEEDAWLACLACGFDRLTFTHYVEQAVGVDYRYFKTFSGLVRDGPTETPATVRYFVRDLDRDTVIDLSRLKAALAEAGTLATAPVGRVGLSAVRSRAFEAAARALLAQNPSGLIHEGAP
jgi:aminoglycoside 3-N-acetyltransferase